MKRKRDLPSSRSDQTSSSAPLGPDRARFDRIYPIPAQNVSVTHRFCPTATVTPAVEGTILKQQLRHHKEGHCTAFYLSTVRTDTKKGGKKGVYTHPGTEYTERARKQPSSSFHVPSWLIDPLLTHQPPASWDNVPRTYGGRR